jgi:hypothetical protein
MLFCSPDKKGRNRGRQLSWPYEASSLCLKRSSNVWALSAISALTPFKLISDFLVRAIGALACPKCTQPTIFEGQSNADTDCVSALRHGLNGQSCSRSGAGKDLPLYQIMPPFESFANFTPQRRLA